LTITIIYDVVPCTASIFRTEVGSSRSIPNVGTYLQGAVSQNNTIVSCATEFSIEYTSLLCYHTHADITRTSADTFLKRPSVKLATHFHLLPKIQKCILTYRILQYIFMVSCRLSCSVGVQILTAVDRWKSSGVSEVYVTSLFSIEDRQSKKPSWSR
jgi:hypothetical protein